MRRSGFAFCVAGTFLLGSTKSFAQLEVNRATGAVSFALSESAEVKGYSISSNNGLLNPETWTSLSDQGIEGWVEANPRDQMLSELNPFGSSDPSANALNLGPAYRGTTTPLSDEDLTVQYIASDGVVFDGEVSYVGPINDFVLRVDPTSGAANLELMSANVGTFDVVGYSIFSDSGALADGNLVSLGEGWSAAGLTPTAVAELNLSGSMLFNTNTTASIGNIFTPGGEQDLRFEFATAGSEKSVQGSVTYGAASVGPVCNPNTLGDVNGNGTVDFPDFLVLSSNFGSAASSHTEGDINCDGAVSFPDFLILSANFGNAVAAEAASVPEPTTGLMSVVAAMLLACVSRKRVRSGAVLTLVGTLALFAINSDTAMALDFNTRMVVLDPDNPGANPQINSTLEARGILNGTVTDVNILDDVTGTVDFIDFAGGAGVFSIDNPYPNGVNNDSLVDFTVEASGFLEIPAGDWYIGFNSDDGGALSMPRVDFLTTTNENGATGAKGELMYNGTRGQGTWTSGSFTVPAGETLRTEFNVVMFERGGGDSLEVAVIDGEDLGNFELVNDDWAILGFELGDGIFDWKLLENGPSPGDFNWDDQVDFADFLILANNFGTGTIFAEGDNNGDARVDLVDFGQLFPLLTPPANAAAVPEPGSLGLLCMASLGLLNLRRRRILRV